MPLAQGWIEYPQLVNWLSRLSAEKRTGTLFCVTESNDSMTIALRNGAIASLSFKTTYGVAALPDMRSTQRCRAKFQEKLVFRSDINLPETAELLQRLKPTNLQRHSS